MARLGVGVLLDKILAMQLDRQGRIQACSVSLLLRTQEEVSVPILVFSVTNPRLGSGLHKVCHRETIMVLPF